MALSIRRRKTNRGSHVNDGILHSRGGGASPSRKTMRHIMHSQGSTSPVCSLARHHFPFDSIPRDPPTLTRAAWFQLPRPRIHSWLAGTWTCGNTASLLGDSRMGTCTFSVSPSMKRARAQRGRTCRQGGMGHKSVREKKVRPRALVLVCNAV